MIEMGEAWCKPEAVFEVILGDSIALGYRDFRKHSFICEAGVGWGGAGSCALRAHVDASLRQ